MTNDEFFEIYDNNDCLLGIAKRSECHGNPALIHRTVHVMVFHPDGRLLLQHRATTKDIQPGKWDTAVGGHVMPGESLEQAAKRELSEELGLSDSVDLIHLFDTKIRNTVESENVRVYKLTHPGPFVYPEDEIDKVKFWELAELNDINNHSDFTPSLLVELFDAKIINKQLVDEY
jgi:isopentenyl-diphosphate delta-isomerase type 1